MARADSATSLAPGFRFHPTDEELVRYYLKRKLSNKPFRFDPISVVDIYKSEPWDLPAKSKLKSRDMEWYFFSALDRKYNNGSKTNRATEKGYWKTTGKDRPIQSNCQLVGMKKTLVYHQGRAPHGERSNWVMHEYRLVENELEKTGIAQDAFVLCRIFQKRGIGPKTGEQYGATPFVEEEWEDDKVAVFPGEELVVHDEKTVDDEAFVETNDLEQFCTPMNFDAGILSGNGAFPLNSYKGDGSNYVEPRSNYSEDDQMPIIVSGENMWDSNLLDGQRLIDLPGQYEMDTEAVKNGYITESGNNVIVDVNNLIDGPFLDANDNLPVSDGFFLEAIDFSNPMDPASGEEITGFDMVDEYLNFPDAGDENMAFIPSEIMGSENVSSDQSQQFQEDLNGETEEVLMATQKLFEGSGTADATCLKQKPNATEFESDMKYPFIKQVSHRLAGILAPPAFASEFPIKDAALRLNAAHASCSVNVTAGLIRIENMGLGGSEIDWSLGKNGNVNIILSFVLPQGDVGPASLLSISSLFSGKTGSVMSRGWFFLMLFWVLMFAVSFKTVNYMCAK